MVDCEETSLRYYQALLDITDTVGTHRDLRGLFGDLAKRLSKVVAFDFLGVGLPGVEPGMLRLHFLEGAAVPTGLITGLEVPIDDTPGGLVWRSQRPLIVGDVATETRAVAGMPLLLQHGVRSLCALPLTAPRARIGILIVGSAAPGVYDDLDLTFLSRVASQAAIAIEAVANHEEAQRVQHQLAAERDRLRVVLTVGNAVASHLDLAELFAAVSASLRDIIDHEFTSLALHDPERGDLRLFAVDFPDRKGLLEDDIFLPVRDTPAGDAFQRARPILADFADRRPLAMAFATHVTDKNLRSGCFLPLSTPRRVIGTLNLASIREGCFQERDLDLLEQVASQVALAIENALAFRDITELKNRLAREKLYLEDEIRGQLDFEEIVGQSRALKKVLAQVRSVASANTTVLILGETGTGKELIARAIHNQSARRQRTFVKLNCAAIPSGLLESELFGHEKGSFTGALGQRIGRFELAHQGTLFLDEVGDIPLDLQPKLLRVLQEREFERLGSSRAVRVDVRLVAATNRDLGTMIAAREFRSDLYYRLNVFPITIPPLRDRPEDIPLLVRFFVQKYNRLMSRRIESVPADAMEALQRWAWPGNVRELENVIERSVILSPGELLQVPLSVLAPVPKAGAAGPETLESAERELIRRVLDGTGWVVGGPRGAAVRLGMKRTTLQSKLRKLGLAPPPRQR